MKRHPPHIAQATTAAASESERERAESVINIIAVRRYAREVGTRKRGFCPYLPSTSSPRLLWLFTESRCHREEVSDTRDQSLCPCLYFPSLIKNNMLSLQSM